jgi:hypothetical protein
MEPTDMKTRVVHIAAALLGVVFAASSTLLEGQAPASSAPAAQVSPAPDPTRLAGQWHFDRDLSTPPTAPTADGVSPPPAGFGGRRGGGGFGGGERGAGRVRGAQTMADDVLALRAFMRELAEPPEVLTIVVAPSEVTMTDERGAVRKIRTDGKKQKVDFGPGAIMETKASWDHDILALELGSGDAMITATYQVTVDGRMLVMTAQPPVSQRNSSRASVPIKLVYTRAEL